METMRVWLADVLIRLSRRLDPKRPETRALSNGQVQVHFDGVPLAKVSAGQVTDLRSARPTASVDAWLADESVEASDLGRGVAGF